MRGALLVLGVVALMACGGSDPDDAIITSPPGTPVDTDPVPSTARPTTTLATTTTTDPAEAAAAAALARTEAWIECAEDPQVCDPVAALSPTTAGDSLDRLVAVIEEWAVEGWVSRPNPNAPPVHTEIVSAAIDSDHPTHADVRVCQVDTGMVVDLGAGPGGEDVIVNDVISTNIADLDVRLGDDEVWRVYDLHMVERLEGATECPDAG
ncbi:MAG: hypothetical protein ACK5PP_06220 [Acidimicrobiales bacterium]